MTRRAPKYVLDTQLFIKAFRDPAANEALQRFHRAFSPFEHLSVIVAQELMHVVGVLAVNDAGHLQPKHKALGLGIVCSFLEQLLACGRRDPEDRLQGGLVLGDHSPPRWARAIGSTVETAARS